MKLKILIIILLSFVFLQISKAQKIKFKLPERLNVGSFEFSPDGKYALIGGSGLWDINLKRKIVSYDLDNPIFSPDGKYVLGVNGTKLQLLSLSGKLIKEFKGHITNVLCKCGEYISASCILFFIPITKKSLSF